MPRPSPNHGTLRLPDDDNDDDAKMPNLRNGSKGGFEHGLT